MSETDRCALAAVRIGGVLFPLPEQKDRRDDVVSSVAAALRQARAQPHVAAVFGEESSYPIFRTIVADICTNVRDIAAFATPAQLAQEVVLCASSLCSAQVRPALPAGPPPAARVSIPAPPAEDVEGAPLPPVPAFAAAPLLAVAPSPPPPRARVSAPASDPVPSVPSVELLAPAAQIEYAAAPYYDPSQQALGPRPPQSPPPIGVRDPRPLRGLPGLNICCWPDLTDLPTAAGSRQSVFSLKPPLMNSRQMAISMFILTLSITFFIVGAASVDKGWFRETFNLDALAPIEVGTQKACRSSSCILLSDVSSDLGAAARLAFASSVIGVLLCAMSAMILAARYWFRISVAINHNILLLIVIVLNSVSLGVFTSKYNDAVKADTFGPVFAEYQVEYAWILVLDAVILSLVVILISGPRCCHGELPLQGPADSVSAPEAQAV